MLIFVPRVKQIKIFVVGKEELIIDSRLIFDVGI